MPLPAEAPDALDGSASFTRRPDLRAMSQGELAELLSSLGEPSYRAQQLFRWLHRAGATSVHEMTNLPLGLRQALDSRATLRPLEVDVVQTSSDGTRKLRLRCEDGQLVESVLIPREQALTLCISSQAGCALGCRFCATATMGLRRNLGPQEILDQVYRARALLDPAERISNLVFMGMGEPLANLDNVLSAIDILCAPAGADFSPRRITISTVGLVPKIAELGRRNRNVGLAVSLHATQNELRSSLMPVNRRWPLEQLMQALREFPLPRRRRITFEYIVLAGLNDSPEDAARLPQLLAGIPAKVNLLAYNPSRSDQPDLHRPSIEALERFGERLRDAGLTVTVRQSRGLDIAAACGQLATSG